jgi:Helix-turn-helix domain
MKTDRIDAQEKQKIAALAATGKSNRAIARATGRDNKTVAKVLKEADVINMKANIEERLADKFEQLTESILDSISEDDLLKASLQQKSISAATLLDKSRLIRGQSTMNAAVIMAGAVIEADRLASIHPADCLCDKCKGKAVEAEFLPGETEPGGPEQRPATKKEATRPKELKCKHPRDLDR